MSDRYGSNIYWQDTAPPARRLALRGATRVDTAIVGGGFTGLWTALQLIESEPSMSVAILESDEVGFGASGRNGGFAMTLLDLSLTALRRNHGDVRARAAHEAVARSVGEMDQTIAREGIDCEWRHGGLLMVATNEGQRNRINADFEAAEAMGLSGFKRLSRAEVQEEVRSPTYLAAVSEDDCGVVHPAKLARGLADRLEARGVTIYHDSAMTGIEETSTSLRIRTAEGSVEADQVVLATNAWATSTPWFGSKVMPLYTYITLTEPLTDDQWDEIGWVGRQGIEDKQNFVHYYRRTDDGRILWGGNDGLVYYGGGIGPGRDRHEGIRAALHSTFRTTFPQLDTVRFTHHWGGPVAITASLLPMFGTLMDGRLHYGLGYNGHGVAPSHTGGRILRDKVLGLDTDDTDLCFVDHDEGRFPPEPLSWIGAELARRSLRRQDRRMADGSSTGTSTTLPIRIMNKL